MDRTSESTSIVAAPPSSGWQRTARCSAPNHREPALRTRPGHGCRRARARGGPRIHLWLVLGRRSSPRARRPRAPGPCARQQLGEPTREERGARREGPGRLVGPRAGRWSTTATSKDRSRATPPQCSAGPRSRPRSRPYIQDTTPTSVTRPGVGTAAPPDNERGRFVSSGRAQGGRNAGGRRPQAEPK